MKPCVRFLPWLFVAALFSGCAILPFGSEGAAEDEGEEDEPAAQTAEAAPRAEPALEGEQPRAVWRIQAGLAGDDDSALQEAIGTAGLPAPAAAPPPPPAEVPTITAPAEEPETLRLRRPLWRRVLFFWQKDPEIPAPRTAPIGSVYLINEARRFVVIESPNAQLVPAAMELAVMRNGDVAATVRVSRERRPPFLVADILTGEPMRGDRVYPIRP